MDFIDITNPRVLASYLVRLEDETNHQITTSGAPRNARDGKVMLMEPCDDGGENYAYRGDEYDGDDEDDYGDCNKDNGNEDNGNEGNDNEDNGNEDAGDENDDESIEYQSTSRDSTLASFGSIDAKFDLTREMGSAPLNRGDYESQTGNLPESCTKLTNSPKNQANKNEESNSYISSSSSSNLIELSDKDEFAGMSEASRRSNEAFNARLAERIANGEFILKRGRLYGPRVRSSSSSSSQESSEKGKVECLDSSGTEDVDHSEHADGRDRVESREDVSRYKSLGSQGLLQHLKRYDLRSIVSQIIPEIKDDREDESNITPSVQPMFCGSTTPKESRPIITDRGHSSESVEVGQISRPEHSETIPNGSHVPNICITKITPINYDIGGGQETPKHGKKAIKKHDHSKLKAQASEGSKNSAAKANPPPVELISSAQKTERRFQQPAPALAAEARKEQRKKLYQRFLGLVPKNPRVQTSCPDVVGRPSIGMSETAENSGSVSGRIEQTRVREICIENLPSGIPLKFILSKVRGGRLDRVRYQKDLRTIKIIFLEHSAARRFYDHLQTYPLSYPNSGHAGALPYQVNVLPYVGESNPQLKAPGENKEILKRGDTRCLFIGFLPSGTTSTKIKNDIMHRLENRSEGTRPVEASDELIESIEVVHEHQELKRTRVISRREGAKTGMCVIVRFASISLAFGAIRDFKSHPDYPNVELSFVEDECSGPLPMPIIIAPRYNQGSKGKSWSRYSSSNTSNASAENPKPHNTSSSSFKKQTSNEIYLSNLPPFMNTQTLTGWIRGGAVDTIYLYGSGSSPKEAVIFFTTPEGARQYFTFIVIRGLYISGRKVQALTSIPDRVKATHDPAPHLRGYPPNGISRFVKIFGVKDEQELLRFVTGISKQQPIITNCNKGAISDLKDVTIQFMGLEDAVHASGELRRTRSLVITYIKDFCDNDVIDLVKIGNQHGRVPRG